MKGQIKIGLEGERQASSFLKEKGYQILRQNWRTGKLEVDIIAENNDYLVFVEVKLRKTDFFGSPESFVGNAKQKRIIKAAQHYTDEFPTDKEIRFDVIAILMGNEQKIVLNHIENAYHPEL